MLELTEDDIKLLNSRKGLKAILTQEDFNLEKAVRFVKYERKLAKLQVELLKLQNWIQDNNKRVIIIFEGRDSAGKGGAIRRITHFLNPRLFKVVALPKPSKDEREQWYFQRYVYHFPKYGEILFLDRSWYNRAVVEPVNGFCSPADYERFMTEVNDFERMLVNENSILIKLYFSISKNEQKNRLDSIINDPLKRWKYSEVDSMAQDLWDDYTRYKLAMFEKTNTDFAPWKIIEADRKSLARLKAIRYILDTIPYKT
jgi:polyphosphate kinase 2